ncbi:MAG: hypothetical protein IT306_19690 [Chloroflexi bacterium]|nr:hypothetical protein [Chloroflexota bacterium]
MQVGDTLQVEVYAHGGWWKDSAGRTGQVAEDSARKGPLATVAVVANRLGMDGWELTEVVSQPHSIYRLAFKLAYLMEDEDEAAGGDSTA